MWGSSPLTRGKRGNKPHNNLPPWLIPAHAGKTLVVMRGPPGSGAHPRSRGENAVIAEKHQGRAGSSPLTRGKPARA